MFAEHVSFVFFGIKLIMYKQRHFYFLKNAYLCIRIFRC